MKIERCIPGTLKLALLLSSSVSLAQFSDDEESLLDLYGNEDMISIATGSQQLIAKAPAVATVITAKQIHNMGATDLDEVLETVPGLHVSVRAAGYNPIYTFRGIHADLNPQILMLVNGIPITNLFHGDRSVVWGGMPVNSISRVEVIRGPGSAIYGADAFAGVINIITKTAGDIDKTETGIRAGSHNTRDAWLVHGGDIGAAEFAFVLEYHDTDGQDEIIDIDAQTFLDTVFNTDASLAPGPLSLMRQSLDMRFDLHYNNWNFRAGLQHRDDLGIGAGAGQALDPNNRYASDRWSADLTYRNAEAFENWDVTAQVSYLNTTQEIEEDLVIFPPGSNTGFGVMPNGLIGNPEVYERHYRANFSAFYDGFSSHTLRVGGGAYYGDLYRVTDHRNFGVNPATGLPLPPDSPVIDISDTPFAFLPEEDRENYFVFVQDIWKFTNDWELTAGVRYDDYSDFGNTVNPRLALVWSVTNNLTSKLLLGRAFRAPSFAETLNANNPLTLGNPDLEPETIESFELAFDFRASETVSYAVNLFSYTWDDIILFVPDPGGASSTAQNAGKQTGQGLELETSWQPTTNLELKGNYAFHDTTNEDTDQDAANSPQNQLYLQLDWQFGSGWHLNTQLNWVMDRKREPGDNRRDIDDYRKVDLTIRRRSAHDNWEVSFAARNIFDADIREPSLAGTPSASIPNDLPMAGRHYFGELRYQF
ncbi:TonB-dependent receptor [Exilibacterium tricleocarpae]|uniref:TonB-dependent receptor n=1 Tax=Exilibacterium tricleocarpae TaxID=2591008 RepID=A0A545U897_9GAMM|nr:TonB-dependent receptor [Exilibacterium tricleocarpae]TQV85697.1 TonB-dependent receptor [Exilibacterium tricleocarpae]